MKLSLKSLIVPLAAALMLAFTVPAHAESSREEIKHAFHLLKWANADYHGHKAAAMEELKAAGHDVGYELEGEIVGWPPEQHQWKSDDQLREARRLLRHARDHYEDQDREHLSHHIEKAIKEIDAALNVN